jgi:acyl dehydratase
VHVEQDSTFHRPIHPGDVLITRGRVVAIRKTSAGALVRTHLTTTHAATGALVVTSWHASIYRGVDVFGSGGSVAEPPAGPPPLATLGQSRSIFISREAAHVYTECASIWNPIHSERRVALAQGLPDVILHGTATWAIAGREIVAFYAGGDPTRLKRLRAKFKSPVIPGHPITLMYGAGEPGVAHFRVTNHHGDPALVEGFALLQA